MKKIILSIAAFAFVLNTWAQAPQTMSYQAIVRNASNVLVTSSNIGMRINILQGTSTGASVYVETHVASTNINGLVTVQIGGGTVVSGTFSGIDWSAGPYFLKTETDPTGGTNYTIEGTSQLASVPYALYADKSGSSGWGLTGNTGTMDGTDFAGTTDDVPFNVRVHNQPAGRIDSAMGNTFWGFKAGNFPATSGMKNTVAGMESLLKNTSGSVNTAVGFHSLVENTTGSNNAGYGFCSLVKNTTGSSNTGIGNWALFLNTASFNTALGDSALYSNTTGTGNAAVGYGALASNTTGIRNTVVGMESLLNNTTGSVNTAGGFHSLVENTTGSNNAGYGFCTLVKNTTGSSNTGIGNWALFLNTASFNTAVGDSALYSNTTGTGNAAVGYGALASNTTGIQNTVVGMESLLKNTSGSVNTAGGFHSLVENTTGSNNVGYGFCTLVKNTTGSSNTGIGNWALFLNTASFNTGIGDSTLYSNTSGANNAALGYKALVANTTGENNTALGYGALSANTTGSNNTAVGYMSNIGAANNNSIALGYQASANEDNVIVLGNSAIQKLYCAQTTITAISDGRFKKNINADIHGLDFIMKLRPVSYNLDVTKLNAFQGKKTDEKDQESIKQAEFIRHNGFIAQEVEKAAKEVNYNFSGLKTPENSGDIYGLGYTDFVVPLVKAVQELNAANDKLKVENDMLKEKLENQSAMISNLQNAQTYNEKEFASLKALIFSQTAKAEVTNK